MDSENQRRARVGASSRSCSSRARPSPPAAAGVDARDCGADTIADHTSSTGGRVPSNLLQYALRAAGASPAARQPNGPRGGTLPPHGR